MIKSNIPPIYWASKDVIRAMELVGSKIEYMPQAPDMDKLRIASEISDLLVTARRTIDRMIDVYER